MIKIIDFSTVYPIWSSHLWPNRVSAIEPTSAMQYLGNYDLKNMNYIPVFLAYIQDNIILGVNSGHKCQDNGYRSRGLYVQPEYRGKGIGTILLQETIKIGSLEGCDYVWSYPRKTSWKTYERAGFLLSSDWEVSELGLNAYVRKDV